MPADQATSTTDSTWHESGNRGIEHAAPDAIAAALGSAVLSFGPGRKVFSRGDLHRMQLLNQVRCTSGAVCVQCMVSVLQRAGSMQRVCMLLLSYASTSAGSCYSLHLHSDLHASVLPATAWIQGNLSSPVILLIDPTSLPLPLRF